MSLLGDVVSTSGVSGARPTRRPALLDELFQMLGTDDVGGGVTRILQDLREAGLDDALSSWVSHGRNQEISADELRRGLGAKRVRRLAQAAGLSEAATAGIVADLLPAIIDRVTPDGTLPRPADLRRAVARLAKRLGA